MSEVWVHGNMFIPRLYGPDNLVEVGGLAGTDQQGLKDGHVARFVLRDQRTNWFHAMIPVAGEQHLEEVRVEYNSASPTLHNVYVHSGNGMVATTLKPEFSFDGTLTTMTLACNNAPVRRGICVSVCFTTLDPGIGQGEISFYAAGAIFA